jgi:hypothetical protein
VETSEWANLSVPTLVHLGLGETSINDPGLTALVGSNINLITLDYCEITDTGLEVQPNVCAVLNVQDALTSVSNFLEP